VDNFKVFPDGRADAKMDRSELQELHYITPVANALSILERGILSHNQALKIQHESVAMDEIQDRRRKVVVPGGKRLHDYVNLYFTGRNPMMYKRHADHAKLCVLRIDTSVLDLPNVVIADQNASSRYVRFGKSPDALLRIDRERLFAHSWQHDDQLEQWRHASLKCAEVLVPDRVEPALIMGAYASCPETLQYLLNFFSPATVVLNADLFFQ
jgi:hypothetical protein